VYTVPKVSGAILEKSRVTARLAISATLVPPQPLIPTKFALQVTTVLLVPHYPSVVQKDSTSLPRARRPKASAGLAKQATTASRTTVCHESAPRVTSAQKSPLNPRLAALVCTSPIKACPFRQTALHVLWATSVTRTALRTTPAGLARRVNTVTKSPRPPHPKFALPASTSHTKQ